MPLSSGTRLGPYQIVGPLGAGGMGEVYRARDVKLDRDVALKVLPDAVATDLERTARFEREAKLLAERLSSVPLAGIVSSPMQRCIETVDAVRSTRAANVPARPNVEIDERLTEVD